MRQYQTTRNAGLTWFLWALLNATAVFLGAAAPSAQAAPTVAEILKGTDRARSGSEQGMSWEVDLQSDESGVKTNSHYRVRTRGDDAYVEALSPPRSKGEVMLFNGRLLWFFKPGLNRPVSLSARQRLSGQAANGDIAKTNYSRDYNGKVTGEEAVNGVPCYVLSLTSKAEDTTYDKIRYWVSKDKLQGLKAEYLALDGTMLKKARFSYGNHITLNGKAVDFVKELRLEDAQNAKNVSFMRFSSPVSEEQPAAIFNVNTLHR